MFKKFGIALGVAAAAAVGYGMKTTITDAITSRKSKTAPKGH